MKNIKLMMQMIIFINLDKQYYELKNIRSKEKYYPKRNINFLPIYPLIRIVNFFHFSSIYQFYAKYCPTLYALRSTSMLRSVRTGTGAPTVTAVDITPPPLTEDR